MNAKSAKDDDYDDEESYDEDLDDEEEDEEFDDDDEFDDDEGLEGGEEPDEEDPSWWVPYGVLGFILLIGLLGFFGLFNKWLGFLAAPVPVDADAAHDAPTAQATAAASAPKPKPLKMPPAAKGEFFGAKHILVMYKGSKRAPKNVTRTKDEAKTRAIEAGKRAKKGDKFEELVKEYSDEPGAGARGGNLGRFRKGTMVPQFQAAVEKLKVGEVSEPVETPFGYHIIVRTL